MTHQKIEVILPAHLRLFRHKFELSQGQAAMLCEVSRATWNRWENGHHTIPMGLKKTLLAVIKNLKDRQQKIDNQLTV